VGRSRASAKAAGSRFERVIADFLAAHVDDRIDRRVKTGSADCGDVGGVRIHGQKLTIECKDTSVATLGPWLNEVERERLNDGALAGLVIAKRRGKGDPGDQLVVLTVRDLIAVLTGIRP
jgi:hypothetical protein